MEATPTPAAHTITLTGKMIKSAAYLEALIITRPSGINELAFDDKDAVLAACPKAKANEIRVYLKGGGNPSNKRSFGSTWGKLVRAIEAA